jgi:chromosomal replication initiation ATPase DnaA
VQNNLENVFRAAQEFAENPRGWLVMTGTYGCGKTHLAAAIGNYRKGMGDDPIFVVVLICWTIYAPPSVRRATYLTMKCSTA